MNLLYYIQFVLAIDHLLSWCSPYSKHLASFPILDIFNIYISIGESTYLYYIYCEPHSVSGQGCQCCSLIVYNKHWVNQSMMSTTSHCIPSIHDPNDSLRLFRCLTSYQKTKQTDIIISLKTDINLFSVPTLQQSRHEYFFGMKINHTLLL